MNLLNENIIKKYLDGIEIMNSRIILRRCVKKAENFNRKYKLFETGGSDAHTVKEVGNGYTAIPGQNLTYNEIKEKLLSRKTKSIGTLSSPFVHVKTVLNKLKKGLYF